MFSFSTKMAVLMKLVFLCLAIAWIGNGTASAACGGNDQKLCKFPKVFKCDKGYAPNKAETKCVPCGGRNEVACEPLRKGKRCTAAYTHEVYGVCRRHGGEGEAKLRGVGFDCRPGFNLDDGGKRCTACGDVNEPSCEAGRPGKRCTAAYTQSNSSGICEARGGEGQEKLRGIGYDCRPGFNIGSAGTCTACGGAGQPSCEATRPGKRCTAAYTQENKDGICEARGGNGQPVMTGLGFECRPGFNWRKHEDGEKRCEPCGGQGQPRCEAMRPGDPCGAGLEVDSRPGRNYCVAEQPDTVDLVYEASKEILRDAGEGIFNAVVPMAFEIHEDQEALSDISDEDEGAAGDLEDDSRSLADLVDFKTLSVGATAEANFIIGVGVEGGVAFDITDREDALKWYSSIGVSNQLGAGSSYGGVIGIWNVRNNQLGKPISEGGAKSVGVIFDVRTFLEFAGKKTSVLTDIGTQSSTATLLIGVWFERDDEVTEYEDLKFTGFTFSPVLGVGTNIAGTTYVEATTFQSYAPVSNEDPEILDLSRIRLAGGKEIRKCVDQCWLEGMGRQKPDQAQVLPVYDQLPAPSAQSGRVTATRASSASVGLENSLWSFQVQGKAFYLKVLEQDAGSITVQRANSGERVKYVQVGSGEYRNTAGQRLVFDNGGSGSWISADGSQTYPMKRVN